MNLNRKNIIIVLIIFGTLFASSLIIIINLDNGYMTGTIHIDGNSAWAAFKATGNCKGKGTYSDPYVIEDLVIDGGGSETCILIENSNIFFRIENCTTFNSGKYGGAGILLLNVNNSKLMGNICFSNEWGIALKYSCNNSILGNTAMKNTHGIYIFRSNTNNISFNEVSNNDYEGISIYNSKFNIVFRNVANENYWAGISFDHSNHNSISGNTLYNNNHTGIYLFNSYNNDLSDNEIIEGGITIEASNDNYYYQKIDTTNLVNGKPLYYYHNVTNLNGYNFTNAGQVILSNCSNTVISNLEISNCVVAIELYRCKSMIISKNIVNSNSRGIKLRYCKNNTISNNTANNNTGDGIFFSQSKGNTIKNNTIKSNRHNGIYFVGRSDNNTIFKNNVKDNEQNGIFFWAGDHNVIKENSIINNGRGIFLYDSDNNLVYYNCFNNTTNARDRINSLDEVHNHWDNGTVGNHWADYTGLDLDDNGIGDDPYTIAGYAGSQDNFPLMKCPFSAQDVVKEYKLMLINKGETQKWLNPLDFTYFS